MFLRALSYALRNEKMENTLASSEQWMEVFSLSSQHHVLPLVLDAVSACCPRELLFPLKKAVRQQVLQHVIQTQELFQVIKHLHKQGIDVLVVKGAVCKRMYPKKELRPSNDEDFLVKEEQFEQCCQALLGMGYHADEKFDETKNEVTFKKEHVLTIELHQCLFSKDAAYAKLNHVFKDVFENAEVIQSDEGNLMTMNPTDYFLYLVFHALKHFVHSGFGIRQVCDIAMCAKNYAESIDWKRVSEQCKAASADVFLQALMNIASHHLEVELDFFALDDSIDADDLLEDLLDSGVYGTSTLSRRHTASLTLDALSKDASGGIFASLFPALSVMKKKYPILEKAPWLLIAAWGWRILNYAKELLLNHDSSFKETLELGSSRIELLKKYEVID